MMDEPDSTGGAQVWQALAADAVPTDESQVLLDSSGLLRKLRFWVRATDESQVLLDSSGLLRKLRFWVRATAS